MRACSIFLVFLIETILPFVSVWLDSSIWKLLINRTIQQNIFIIWSLYFGDNTNEHTKCFMTPYNMYINYDNISALNAYIWRKLLIRSSKCFIRILVQHSTNRVANIISFMKDSRIRSTSCDENSCRMNDWYFYCLAI